MDPQIAMLSDQLWTEKHEKESKLQDERDHVNRALFAVTLSLIPT